MNSGKSQTPFLFQKWRDLLFLHWEYPVDAIQATLPPGLSVDTFEGKAYLAIVPFRMRSLRLRGLPSVPSISDFIELNLRTYVRDEHGRSGVWFYSLEADSRISVAIANVLFHLPYRHAIMSCEESAERFTYNARASRDVLKEEMHFDFEVRSPLGTATKSSLEAFMVERYRLFTERKSNKAIYTGTLWHEPYKLRDVAVHSWSERLFELNGFEPPRCPPASALYSRGVDVSVFPISEVKLQPAVACSL